MKTAQQIAAAINESGKTYYGDKARGWDGNGVSRIYFGKDFVTLTSEGPTNETAKARAVSIGKSAVALVAEYC